MQTNDNTILRQDEVIAMLTEEACGKRSALQQVTQRCHLGSGLRAPVRQCKERDNFLAKEGMEAVDAETGNLCIFEHQGFHHKQKSRAIVRGS